MSDGCIVCGKPLQLRFEDLEDTERRDRIEMLWERAGPWSVCKKHEEPLLRLLETMQKLNVNPEVNPKPGKLVSIEGKGYKEWLRQHNMKVEPSIYDSDYCSFEIPEEAAKHRKNAIDYAIKNGRQQLIRWLIFEADGCIAESLMMGDITYMSRLIVAWYEFIETVAMSGSTPEEFKPWIEVTTDETTES